MDTANISDLKLGIIAGGQLGKMLSLAAANWDIETYVLDADKTCPAAKSCSCFIEGDYLSYDDVYRFGKQVDLLTFEIENVNIEALKQLQEEGLSIFPKPESLELIKDKGLQKLFYQKNGQPTAAFQLYDTKAAILKAIQQKEILFPFVQKLRTGGYDGRGVAIIRSEDKLENLLYGPSLIETCVDIEKEIAVIVARNESGNVKCFPVVEMEFNANANLVEKLIFPASLSKVITDEAEEIATSIVDQLNFVGLLAVELFVDKSNRVWVNEVAPRPHNSGHHTIEGVITSQYEQLLRAILNFPLGSTAIKMPCVMINLLGEPGYQGKVKYEGLNETLAIEGVKVHLYGKKETRPFRKMGHVTILANSIEEASKKADLVKERLKVKS